ncbi:MAG: ABC transporter permease [Synergistaceae bacterium]|jgi:putative ABC transport system permease protein|nr:ABC transporter permease [Synergistaceae bacterium]
MKFRTEIRISLRHLRSRSFQTVSAAAVLALSSALAVMLFILAQGFRDGLIRAVEPFDLIVGAKGSPYQLVLNTVLLRDVPIGNIKWSDHAALSDDARTDFSIPLAFGDSYRGYPVIGTGDGILRIRRGARDAERQWLEVAEGRWFEDEFEAVLGAQTAAESKLRIGDSFRTSHGVVLEDEHEDLFKVVGIAARVFGPYDRAVFVNIESIWENHAHGDHDEDEEDTHDDDDDKEVTAVLVRPASYPDAYSLAVSFQNDAGKQLVFPAQTAARLFALMGSGERFMSVIVYSVAACSLLTTTLVLYWSNRDRCREKALLGALGASRGSLVIISWLEGIFTLTIGALAGELLGRASAYAAYSFLAGATAIDISVPMTFREAIVPAVMLIAGSFGVLVMALGEKTGDAASLKKM